MDKYNKIKILQQRIKQIEIEISNFDFKDEEEIQHFNELDYAEKKRVQEFLNNKKLALNALKDHLSILENDIL